MALVIPLLWSDDISGRGLYRILAAVFGILFFLSLFNAFSKNQVWLIVLIISISGFIQSCFGIIKLWLLPELTIPHGIPTGVFLQYNVMSSYIATTFIMSLLMISIYPVPNKKLKKCISCFISMFALFSGAIIISLNSATSYLILIISIPLMVLAHKDNAKGVLIGILCFSIGCYVGQNFTGTFNFHTENHGYDIGSSYASVVTSNIANTVIRNFDPGGRETIWLICWEIFKDNWVRGVGYGNFEHYFMEYQAQYYQQHGIYAFEKIGHPHNEFILWSVEGGILPALAFISYSLYVLFRMFKLGKAALPYAALLIPLVGHALLEFPFYHSAIHWILFVTLLYLFELKVTDTIAINVNYKKVINIMAFIFIISTSLFFLTNMHAIITLNKYNETEFQERNVKTLSSILNNFTVRFHLDYLYMDTFLRRGVIEKNVSYINQSILFSEKLNANHPRPAYYKNMLVAYEALSDKEKFEEKLKEARYLYPKNDYFIGVEERYKLLH